MKDVFLIFEGGGARCIAHIGALRALERKGVDIKGVAGTSAGAMIAALVAAGYRSEDLFSIDGETAGMSPVLRSVGLQAAQDLFRRRDLLALTVLARPLLMAGRWAVVAAVALIVGGFMGAGYWAQACLPCGVAVATIEIAILLLVAYRLLSGLASLDRLRDKLDQALRLRLDMVDEPGRPATFRDLRQRGRPLRIVATNVDRGTLRLFSDKTTPDMAVADAVTASMAVPLLFKPRRIDGQRHVDGALVSNLPAWTFDEERALFPDAATIAFEIADPRSVGEANGNGASSLMAGIARSALFGATVLERRGTQHLQGFPLQTTVGLLDFDMPRARVVRAIRNAQAFTDAEIDFRLIDLPRHYRQACKDIHDGVHTLLAHSPRIGDCPMPAAQRIIRVNVAFQEAGNLDSLRIRYGYGMDGYPDNDLVLPIAGSQAGDVYVSQVARVFAVQPDDGADHWLDGAENRHRRQLRWPDMKWVFAIPISVYDAGRAPLESRPAVLHIDSNVPVPYFDLDLTEDEWNWYGHRFGDVIELVDHALRQLPYDRAPGVSRRTIPDHEIALDGIVPAERPTARGKLVLAAADAYAAASECRLAADIKATLDRRAASIERIEGDEASKRWLRRR